MKTKTSFRRAYTTRPGERIVEREFKDTYLRLSTGTQLFGCDFDGGRIEVTGDDVAVMGVSNQKTELIDAEICSPAS